MQTKRSTADGSEQLSQSGVFIIGEIDSAQVAVPAALCQDPSVPRTAQRAHVLLETLMLSNLSRWLTYLLAILDAILGAFLFLLPETLAPVFAWKVTPCITMTIGGWALGNAWLAWVTGR